MVNRLYFPCMAFLEPLWECDPMVSAFQKSWGKNIKACQGEDSPILGDLKGSKIICWWSHKYCEEPLREFSKGRNMRTVLLPPVFRDAVNKGDSRYTERGNRLPRGLELSESILLRRMMSKNSLHNPMARKVNWISAKIYADMLRLPLSLSLGPIWQFSTDRAKPARILGLMQWLLI